MHAQHKCDNISTFCIVHTYIYSVMHGYDYSPKTCNVAVLVQTQNLVYLIIISVLVNQTLQTFKGEFVKRGIRNNRIAE